MSDWFGILLTILSIFIGGFAVGRRLEMTNEEVPDTNVGDTISRQAAYATALAMYVRCDTGDIEDYRDLMCESILALPPAQPEIIRCKDCKNQEKFFQKDGRRKNGGYYIYGCSLAEGYSHVCLDDDYCSRAERKEGQDE